MEASIEYEQLIRPIELTNRLTSIWPLVTGRDSTVVIRLRPVHRLLLFIMLGIISIAVTLDVAYHWGDMEEVTECGLIASAFYLSIIRLVVYTIHGKDLYYIVETMRNDWLKSNVQDQTVLKEKCFFAFTLARHFIVTVAIAGFAFILVPILEVKTSNNLIF